MSKVSVVVPIYNVEEYLPRCLDSIVAQTYKDIEIILVDDGSPDNAGVICDEYATKDERIRVFHTPNGGVGKARQFGVESSTGEYIVFVDPDDWLPLDAVEILYSNMSDDVDLVSGTPKHIYGNISKLHNTNSRISDNVLSEMLRLSIVPQPWAKLYRRSLFNGNSFPDFKKSQDWLMNIEVCTRVRKAKIINEIVYFYFDSRDSSTVNSYITTVENELDFIDSCRDILINNGRYNECKDAYAHFVEHCLERALSSNLRLNYRGDIRIQNILLDISRCKLSFRTKVKFFIFRYKTLQTILMFYRKLRTR